jgi:hypothetical protein
VASWTGFAPGEAATERARTGAVGAVAGLRTGAAAAFLAGFLSAGLPAFFFGTAFLRDGIIFLQLAETTAAKL